MKGVKRFLVFFLSCVLALSTVGLAPMTAKAEGSSPINITGVETTYTFTSTTNEGANDNWNTPFFTVFAGDVPVFNGRSDAAGWIGEANTWGTGLPTGYAYETSFDDSTFVNWPSWLAANKAGVECKITMRQVDGYAVVALYNNGVTSIVTIPGFTGGELVLSEDNCVLTNITPSNDHLDLSAAIEKIQNGGDDVPEETFDLVDNSTSANINKSPRIEVTDVEQTYTFKSTSAENASANWHSPTFFVYSNNSVLFTGRSDAAGWVGGANTWDTGLPEGYKYQTSFDDPTFVSWESWLAANKAGVECKITMRQVGNYAVVALYDNGVTSITTIPTSGTVSVALSGENCKLENIVSSDAHLDLSAAIDQIPTDEPGTDEPGTDEPGTDDPGTDEPGTDEPGTDTPGGVFLDCPGWWQAHTAGMEITEEPQTYTFHSKTYAGKMDNWNTPVFVVFSSEDGLVKEAGAAGYTEYGVIRSDHYHWGDSISETSVVYPAGFDADWDASWAAWQAANRAGVDCAVTTQLYNGYAVVGVSNNGITTTYAIKVNPAVKNYLSLTGELCTLSNLQTSDQHIDLSAAKAGADAGITPSNNTNSSNNSSAPAAPASSVRAIAGGEVLSGSAWWSGMAIGSNQPMSGDGTWSWVVQATSLIDGYGAFSVEVYDPVTNGYITTGSDMNAWTAEGFAPANAMVLGVPAELASNLVEGHAYVVTVTRSGNSFTVQYVDFTDNKEICTLTIVPGEMVSNDVVVHVMAQVGTYVTAFCEGALVDAPAGAKAAKGGEVLKGTEWWAGMMKGADRLMSGDGTWTWTVKASSLMDGYGAFSVEIYDPSTNGYITTGSDKNAWTAEGFNPDTALVTGVPKTLDSKLVEGHTYAVTVTRLGNTFTVRYTDHTTGKEICTLVITPAEIVGKNVQIHVMAQVGTFVTAFNEGTLIAALGDSIPVAFYVIAVIGLAAIIFGLKKRFAK